MISNYLKTTAYNDWRKIMKNEEIIDRLQDRVKQLEMESTRYRRRIDLLLQAIDRIHELIINHLTMHLNLLDNK